MWCLKCNKELSQCTCPDLKERLEKLRNLPYIHAPSMVDKPLLENKLRTEQLKPKDQ